jgi:hypothetical protein
VSHGEALDRGRISHEGRRARLEVEHRPVDRCGVHAANRGPLRGGGDLDAYMNNGRFPNKLAVPGFGDSKTRRSKAEFTLMALLNRGRKSATRETRSGEGIAHL